MERTRVTFELHFYYKMGILAFADPKSYVWTIKKVFYKKISAPTVVGAEITHHMGYWIILSVFLSYSIFSCWRMRRTYSLYTRESQS